jgi:hypothetical protein
MRGGLWRLNIKKQTGSKYEFSRKLDGAWAVEATGASD